MQRAYWDLVFARRDQEIKRESVELANTQLEHNERLVEAGTLAKSDIISARVELERRKDEAEAAVDAIQRAENALKALMAQAGDGEIWQSELVPVEQPQIEASASLPLEDALRLALQNRPEMEQYRLRGELNKIDAEYLRDQTRPQVDFFVTYGTVGLAGAKRDTVNPFTASNAALFGRVNQLSALAGLPALPPVGFGAPPEALIGSYGQSFYNLLKNDFRSWRFGLKHQPAPPQSYSRSQFRTVAGRRQADRSSAPEDRAVDRSRSAQRAAGGRDGQEARGRRKEFARQRRAAIPERTAQIRRGPVDQLLRARSPERALGRARPRTARPDRLHESGR